MVQATTLLPMMVLVAIRVEGRTKVMDLEQIQDQDRTREMARLDHPQAIALVLAPAATAMLVPTQMQDPAQAAGQMEMATTLGQIRAPAHLLGMDLALALMLGRGLGLEVAMVEMATILEQNRLLAHPLAMAPVPALVLTAVMIPVEVVVILGQTPSLARLLGMALGLEMAMIPATTASLLTALVRVLMAALLQQVARLKVMILKAMALEATALKMVALEVMPHRLHHRLT